VRHLFFAVSAAALLVAPSAPIVAQAAQSATFLDAGSERERVLRVLQLTGDAPYYPWSIRALSPRELDSLTLKTPRGQALMPRTSLVHAVGGLRYEILPLQVGAVYNSAFPYGNNDGPLWAGRGLTASLSGGIAGRIGPLSFQAEPMMFDAQNQRFSLMPNGVPGNPFADGYQAIIIDQPQRFGDKQYRRFDLGQSSIRLDVGPAMAELSTANQFWGPALDEPLILGDNAAGFPHFSLGTSRPISIWIGQVHGRAVWGQLRQTAYSTVTGPDSLRFMSGFIASFTPRGVPTLELGITRFFHSPWPQGGLSHARFGRAFEGILKSSLGTTNNPTGDDPSDNQLASVFFRWAFPGSSAEVYGEYGREDHNVVARDFWQEPDHDAAYTLGLRRVWKRGERSLFSLSGEVTDSRVSPLQQGRGQAPWYVHFGTLQQGHTELGQVLGGPGVFGGGAASIAADAFDERGRWTVRWDRLQRAELLSSENLGVPSKTDVIQSIGLERVQSRGSMSLNGGVRALVDLNRNQGSDQFSLQLTAGVRAFW
jgi:hypothetical protein